MSDDSIMLGYYKRFLAGDESAFTYLVRAYYDQLLFFVSRIVGNFRDAEEIASDAFVHIAVRKKAFRGEASLKTYLFAVGRNKAVDLVRKNAARRSFPIQDAETVADEETLEGRILRSERDRKLHQAISELCEDYRCVLYLVYFQNMSAQEASQVMKKTRKQTENLIWRARHALRTILEKDGWEYENL